MDAQTLLDVAKALTSQPELVPLIGQILERAAALLQADRASLFLLDRARGELWSKVAQGMRDRGDPLPHGPRPQPGTSPRTGEMLNIADAYQHPLFNAEIDQRTGYRTAQRSSCAPIRDQNGETIGVISVINRREGTFTEADVAVPACSLGLHRRPGPGELASSTRRWSPGSARWPPCSRWARPCRDAGAGPA